MQSVLAYPPYQWGYTTYNYPLVQYSPYDNNYYASYYNHPIALPAYRVSSPYYYVGQKSPMSHYAKGALGAGLAVGAGLFGLWPLSLISAGYSAFHFGKGAGISYGNRGYSSF